MRIASLLPSATEIVYALGLDDRLVGVTHECDFPPDARAKPSLTRSALPPGMPSARIDEAVRAEARDAHTIYALDAERLRDLSPDVVLTQSLCEVCAVSRDAVDAAVCTMPEAARVVSLDPHTLDEVLESIEAAGQALGARERARALTGALRARIEAVRRAVDGAPRRRVVCLEWLDPPYRAGHWVPEQARLAGGEDVLGRAGEPSCRVAWDEVVAAQPEVLVLMPCGFGAAEAASRIDELSTREGWAALPAVRTGDVYAVDGSAYFSRPGPRLVDGIELLARALHPQRATARAPEGCVLKATAESGATRFRAYT